MFPCFFQINSIHFYVANAIFSYLICQIPSFVAIAFASSLLVTTSRCSSLWSPPFRHHTTPHHTIPHHTILHMWAHVCPFGRASAVHILARTVSYVRARYPRSYTGTRKPRVCDICLGCTWRLSGAVWRTGGWLVWAGGR